MTFEANTQDSTAWFRQVDGVWVESEEDCPHPLGLQPVCDAEPEHLICPLCYGGPA